MAGKPTFAKLGLKKKAEVKTIEINGNEIDVKQYLPVNDKIDVVTNVLQNSVDENSFVNPIKVEVYFALEIMYNYTNLNFTEKQKEDPVKLYDLLEENGIFEQIMSIMPVDDYNLLYSWVEDTIAGFEKHRDSAMGILEQVSADYSNLDFEASEIQKKIADPDNLTLLKDVVNKLG